MSLVRTCSEGFEGVPWTCRSNVLNGGMLVRLVESELSTGSGPILTSKNFYEVISP